MWEPVTNLMNSKRLVDTFHQSHPVAPHTLDLKKLNFQKVVNYTTLKVNKTLYGWEDGAFDRDYLKRVEKKWTQWSRDRWEAYSRGCES